MTICKSSSLDPEVERELTQLSQCSIVTLRHRWHALFRKDPPRAFGPDLLRRSIAQKIQEQTYGGLAPTTRRLLDQLVKAHRGKPAGKIELPRRIMPGAVLVREWKGTTHRVTARGDGFAYEHTTYPSLSEIARLITGSRWNGPRFFGLRPGPTAKPPKDAPTSRINKEVVRVVSQNRHTRAGNPETEVGSIS
jgi:hypothetical protein